MGILPDGTCEVLWLWIDNAEGTTFWNRIFNNLQTLGMVGILIAVADGLKGVAGRGAGALTVTTALLARECSNACEWKLTDPPSGGTGGNDWLVELEPGALGRTHRH